MGRQIGNMQVFCCGINLMFCIFAAPNQIKGRVAERLGRGLQNLVQQFKSARDLREKPLRYYRSGFLFVSNDDLKLYELAMKACREL